jgi:hypothetical protein
MLSRSFDGKRIQIVDGVPRLDRAELFLSFPLPVCMYSGVAAFNGRQDTEMLPLR